MSSRTCSKCRLHGQVDLLKGHKRVCTYANCTCNKCASHDYALAHKNALREQTNDKGRLWRKTLSQTCSKPSGTATVSTPFPEMSKTVAGSEENATLAFQMANFEESKATVERKKKNKAEKRKG